MYVNTPHVCKYTHLSIAYVEIKSKEETKTSSFYFSYRSIVGPTPRPLVPSVLDVATRPPFFLVCGILLSLCPKKEGRVILYHENTSHFAHPALLLRHE